MSRFYLGYVIMLSLLHKNIFITFCVIIVLFMLWMFPLQIIGGMVAMILFLCNIKRGLASIAFTAIVCQSMECAMPWNEWIRIFYDEFRFENPFSYIFTIYTIVYFSLLSIERTIGKIGFWRISPFILSLVPLFIIPLYYFPSCPIIFITFTILTLAIYGCFLLSAIKDQPLKDNKVSTLFKDIKHQLFNKNKIKLFLLLIITEFTIGVIYSDDYIDYQSREMIEAYTKYLSNEEHTYLVETEYEGFRNYEIKLRRENVSKRSKHSQNDTSFIGYFLVETSPFRIDVKRKGWGASYLVESVPYGKLFHLKKQKANDLNIWEQY